MVHNMAATEAEQLSQTSTWTTDTEVEFSILPGHFFAVNAQLLGLPFPHGNATTSIEEDHRNGCNLVSVQASSLVPGSNRLVEMRRRVRMRDCPPFPRGLITAFRVVGDSYTLNEEEGMVVLIQRGLFLLQSNAVDDYHTDLRIEDYLAGVAVYNALGLQTPAGKTCAVRARDIAKACLDDIVLTREVLAVGLPNQHSSGKTLPTSTTQSTSQPACETCASMKRDLVHVGAELETAQQTVARLERENRRLLRALDDAYFGRAKQVPPSPGVAPLKRPSSPSSFDAMPMDYAKSQHQHHGATKRQSIPIK